MMEPVKSTNQSWWQTCFWWLLTIVSLVVLDDLVNGPIFWLIATFNRQTATILAWLLSFSFQLWLIANLLQPKRKLAVAMLDRLRLGHKGRLATYETSLKRRVSSATSALLMSLLIGGVLPIMLLAKRHEPAWLYNLGVATSTLYAFEFALIHGGYGLGAIADVIAPW